MSWEEQLLREWNTRRNELSPSARSFAEPLGKALVLCGWLEARLTLGGSYWTDRSESQAWAAYTALLSQDPVKWAKLLMSLTASLPQPICLLAPEVCQLLCAKEENQRRMFSSFDSFISVVIVAIIVLRELLQNLQLNNSDSGRLSLESDNIAKPFADTCVHALPPELGGISRIPLSNSAQVLAREIHRRRARSSETGM